MAANINEASFKSSYKVKFWETATIYKVWGNTEDSSSSQRKRLASNSLTLKISENKAV